MKEENKNSLSWFLAITLIIVTSGVTGYILAEKNIKQDLFIVNENIERFDEELRINQTNFRNGFYYGIDNVKLEIYRNLKSKGYFEVSLPDYDYNVSNEILVILLPYINNNTLEK